MKKRLRKKLHINEFKEYGIDFTIKFTGQNRINTDKLMDQFIDFLEVNHTYCGGGGDDNKWEMIVEVNKHEHTPEELTGKIKGFFDGKLNEGFEFESRIVDLWNE